MVPIARESETPHITHPETRNSISDLLVNADVHDHGEPKPPEEPEADSFEVGGEIELKYPAGGEQMGLSVVERCEHTRNSNAELQNDEYHQSNGDGHIAIAHSIPSEIFMPFNFEDEVEDQPEDDQSNCDVTNNDDRGLEIQTNSISLSDSNRSHIPGADTLLNPLQTQERTLSTLSRSNRTINPINERLLRSI